MGKLTLRRIYDINHGIDRTEFAKGIDLSKLKNKRLQLQQLTIIFSNPI